MYSIYVCMYVCMMCEWIGIPAAYYDTVIDYVTLGMDSCEDTVCSGTTLDRFPVLMVALAPDNVFPLLPADYVECTGSNTNGGIEW